jgi:FkbM family methyltransferase
MRAARNSRTHFSVRAIFERASRNRWLKRRLPNGVPLFISPDSQLKYLKGEFDADLIQLCDELVTPESVVWDIGANCGVFSFAAANAKAIVAVEADPFLAFLLQQSVELNGLPVSIVPAAAYSAQGLTEFAIAKRGRASNYIVKAGGHSQAGGERGRVMSPTVTLDLLLGQFGPPTLIKIDVEGAEADVLRGASRLLKHKPVIYLEVSDHTMAECRTILEDAGYRLESRGGPNWLALPRTGA